MYIEQMDGWMDGWIGKWSRWKGKGKKGGEMKVTLKKRKKKGRQEKKERIQKVVNVLRSNERRSQSTFKSVFWMSMKFQQRSQQA